MAGSKKSSATSSRKRVKAYHAGPTPAEVESQIKIKVFGIGGGGGNAISRMKEHMPSRTIELIAINTDTQDLVKCDIRRKIQIGKNLTRGRGTGMEPEIGRQAAEENRSEIVEAVKGADLLFITAGLGGGTGSGAAPVVAEIAKEHGALTIAIVTKPFLFEGSQRNRIAEEALMRLRERVDALIVVPNDRVFNVIKKDTPHLKALERIDDILKDAIAGISELISATGIINLDFSDIKTIMKEAGSALIGVGIATGANRAQTAASLALNSPLLEFSVEGARGVLFGVSGGRDIKMQEINDIAKAITATIDPSAKIIFGAYHDRKLNKGAIKVTLIATGFNGTIPKSSPEMMGASLFGMELVEEVKPGTPLPLGKSEKQDARSKKQEKPEKEDRKPAKGGSASGGKDLNAPVGSPVPAAAITPESKKADIWEIPAFLRKKRRL